MDQSSSPPVGPDPVIAPDEFGDRFELGSLPLARPGSGYAVQQLDTDLLLDTRHSILLPVRSTNLNGLFSTFDAAFAGAKRYLTEHNLQPRECPLAIVPASFDDTLRRHILIYGVLTCSP